MVNRHNTNKKIYGQKGLMSKEIINRIDSLNETNKTETNPYLSSKKTTIEKEKMFNSEVYDIDALNDDKDTKEFGITFTIIAIILVIACIIISCLI